MKPFLKWVGGKQRIVENLLEKFPKKINNYYEPFLGGGSVLIAVLTSKIEIHGKIYASDCNKDLINAYKVIQSNPRKLIEVSKTFETSKEAYYIIRERYNKNVGDDDITRAAMFVYLNKTCFRGLHRIGPNGFNVPYGNYKNPTIVDEKNIMELSSLFHKVIFLTLDYKEALKNVIRGDFVYLDPPYVKETCLSFTKYNKDSFENHEELFETCKGLRSFVLSNSNTKIVRDSFECFNITEILCRRSINSKFPESTVKELIITPKTDTFTS